MKTKLILTVAWFGLFPAAFAAPPEDGSVLPFPPTPSASKAGPTLQGSTHKRRVEPKRLPKDAPNVLIVLIDDAGFGVPDTFGGFAHTPTLSKLRDEGISYNRFHTTSICTPTRAALLTGRNHQRVGNGTIAERAVDWDGYTGVMPKTSATIAEVLKERTKGRGQKVAGTENRSLRYCDLERTWSVARSNAVKPPSRG